MAKIIDLDIVLPLIVEPVQPNTVEVGTPEIISVGTSSIEVSQRFSSDVDYYGGIYVGESADNNDDATLVKNPGYLNKTITGLSAGTTYYVNGVGIPVLGNITVGEQISVTTSVSPIPDEYQLVEYLQSSGTQYINLGRSFSRGAVLSTKIRHTALTNYNTYFGAYSTNLHNILRFKNFNGYGINPCIGSVSDRILYNSINTGIDYEFDISNFDNKITFRMDSTFNQQNVAGAYSQLQCYLFTLNFNGNIDTTHSFIGRMYYANIYEQDIIDIQTVLTNPIFRLYPVYRKSDSKPGMYDIVGNQLYTNQGSGEFIVGPDKEWE